MARKERFGGGGLDKELALFDELKTRIRILEEELHSAPRFSAEEKTTLEKNLADERAEKIKHLEDKQRAQTELAQANERITHLELEKNRLESGNDELKETKVSQQNTISKLSADLDSSREFRDRLTNVIKVIEQEKAANFESGLVLARRHTEAYPGWEQINWGHFKVPPNLEVPVPPYFFWPGRIRNAMDQSKPTDPKDPGHS